MTEPNHSKSGSLPLVRPFPRSSSATPADQIPPEVRDIVLLLEEACGRNIVGVIFFGSRLVGTSPGEASAADLVVVVENYLFFYESIGSRLPAARHSGIMAALNRTLPPNIIYLNDPGGLRAGRYVPFGPFLAGVGVVVLLAGTQRVLGWIGQ